MGLNAYPGIYKVGRTKNIEGRVKGLQTAVPEPIRVMHTAWFQSSPWGESAVHKMIGNHKRKLGEWFEEDIERIIQLITKAQDIEYDDFWGDE